jgi:hypothetical protein
MGVVTQPRGRAQVYKALVRRQLQQASTFIDSNAALGDTKGKSKNNGFDGGEGEGESKGKGERKGKGGVVQGYKTRDCARMVDSRM